MRALIADLRSSGLRFAEEGPAPSEGPLAGKTLVLTGTLPDSRASRPPSGSWPPAGA